ncbi:DNA-J related domain-containing protein [Halopseudomonas salegens]|uniref:DNA-J related domain-containing protein n=1 Tax=Halopseudomonas salegens TaxID=1434072 RepID=UPI0012FD90F5|nr:DNA-J related domain-containing protein [Halopseudomonas salegens]
MQLQPEDLLPADFSARLLNLLRTVPQGIDEYGLIKQLAVEFPASPFAVPGALREPLSLFQLHFLLFHELYKLADEVAGQGQQLDIHALTIRLGPRLPGYAGLQREDPMRSYYLDWGQWVETNADDVERLLGDFFQGRSSIPPAEHARALRLFGLQEPVTAGQIKRRYRQMLSQHHPDRGGSTADAQAINDAFLILQRYYGKV